MKLLNTEQTKSQLYTKFCKMYVTASSSVTDFCMTWLTMLGSVKDLT